MAGAGWGAGSSPRRRGTAYRNPDTFMTRRFIPAQAGNSCCLAARHLADTVHPRAGGEQSLTIASRSEEFGSSPRRRGTVKNRGSGPPVYRFIPAQAGNRIYRTNIPVGTAVHPRAGGEQEGVSSSDFSSTGSSPRRRGTEKWSRCRQSGQRFIPAQAGNRSILCSSVIVISVHPRAGGEQTPEELKKVLQFGSSPRRRGTD